jgi:endonuclease/exonuclease/phosphatase family metal-dependent hydrolase
VSKKEDMILVSLDWNYFWENKKFESCSKSSGCGMFKFLRSVVFLVNILLAFITLLGYQLCYSADIGHWAAGFIMLAMPAFIISNVVFCLFWWLTNYRQMWLSGLILLIGIPLMGRSFQFPSFEKTMLTGSSKISVLSYNVMYCDYVSYGQDRTTALGIVNALDTLSADIKCFQELYNNDKIPDLRTIYKLTDTHPYYTYMHSAADNNEGQGNIGLAVFSRYPIIRKQEIFWKRNNNGMLLVDIAVNDDTVRVINVQMHSMGIRVQKVIAARESKDEAKVKAETRNILSLLKSGFEIRRIQADELAKWIADSPYPTIVCGDFNEIPFGYAYGHTSKLLQNAFESSGSGFGFTYNRMPNIIRIDNQFYDDTKIDNYAFETLNKARFSDHYPVRGGYLVR